jgi:cobalt-zinc-cadmium resistance protein CzcA
MNRIVASSLAAAASRHPDDARADRRGARSLQRLPVDAYPDLSPPWSRSSPNGPGHAAEEVERLITVPVELGMNGIPKDRQRPLDLAVWIVRRHPHVPRRHGQLLRPPGGVQPLPGLSLPSGVTPSVSPLSSPSGLIYRYVLQSPTGRRWS